MYAQHLVSFKKLTQQKGTDFVCDPVGRPERLAEVFSESKSPVNQYGHTPVACTH
jgi:hypothetical protein